MFTQCLFVSVYGWAVVCQSVDVLSAEGLRADGRRAGELRRLVVQCGVLTSPSIDGSAVYQQGNTRVLCCVSGPRELSERRREEGGVEREHAKVIVELSSAAFAGSARRSKRRMDRRQAEMSLWMERTLQPLILTSLFPNSEISLSIDVLQDDGGVLPCAINAATLALLHSGVPLNDVLIAVNLAVVAQPTVPSAFVLLLDPPLHEVGAWHPSVQVGIGCVSGKVGFMLSAGQLSVSALESALSMATMACRAIQREINEEMRRFNEANISTRGRINA